MEIFYEGAALVEPLADLPDRGARARVAARARSARRSGASRWSACCSGLSALARQNMLLYAPLFAVWALCATGRRRGRLRAAPRSSPCSLLALCATIAPATLRNRYVERRLRARERDRRPLALRLAGIPSASSTYAIPDIFPRALADDPIERKAAYTELAQRAARPLAAARVRSLGVLARRRRSRSCATTRRARSRSALERARLFWNRFEPWDVRSFTVSRGDLVGARRCRCRASA